MIRIRPRAALTLALASIVGLAMFLWPLLLQPSSTSGAHTTDSPMVFVLLLPALIAVVIAELSDGGIDSKALAMLGVLAALGAALRPLGAGTAGIETVFFLLVLAGRVYGAGFGFVLGAITLFASALLTGGVGPWLPFQMLASAWVGLGAGLLPPAKGKLELVLLAGYGAFSAYAFGFLLNLWFWPFALGTEGPLSYVPGGSVATNLTHFFRYCFATSAWGWDTMRAVTNVLAIFLAGPLLLGALRRAARKAAFDAPVAFSAPIRKPLVPE